MGNTLDTKIIMKNIKNEIENLNLQNGIKNIPIITAYRGSIAHNMYVPNTDSNSIDDIDIIEIYMPSIDCYFGLTEFGSKGTKEIKKDEYDVVIFDLKKTIKLLSQGNPNILSLLFLKKEHYINVTKEGNMLLENKHIFIGKHIYNSFVGYAEAQLSKMKKFTFEGYMGEKRKRLVEKYGFDTKNASHAIRLLRMGVEFLGTGELKVYRDTDAEELLDIKTGKWSFEKVNLEAEKLFRAAELAKEKSKLAENLNFEKINKLTVDICKSYYFNL